MTYVTRTLDSQEVLNAKPVLPLNNKAAISVKRRWASLKRKIVSQLREAPIYYKIGKYWHSAQRARKPLSFSIPPDLFQIFKSSMPPTTMKSLIKFTRFVLFNIYDNPYGTPYGTSSYNIVRITYEQLWTNVPFDDFLHELYISKGPLWDYTKQRAVSNYRINWDTIMLLRKTRPVYTFKLNYIRKRYSKTLKTHRQNKK